MSSEKKDVTALEKDKKGMAFRVIFCTFAADNAFCEQNRIL